MVKLGHRPSRNEWVANDPEISYDTIYRYFGSWKDDCLKFIEYKSGEKIDIEEKTIEKKPIINFTNNKIKNMIGKTRTIPLSIRVKALSRDNFCCIFCGKSPATDVGTKLHIDHKIPFSKGGTNDIDNLQTLCEEGNLGKSDSIIKK